MNRYTDREKYFLELAETSKAYYLDYIGKYKRLGKGSRILEIGCGEGGNLLPFAEIGCSVKGIDLSENKINNARLFFGKRNAEGEFACGNFLEAAVPADEKEKFDVILIHDVIEHIEPEYKMDFFTRLRFYLKAEGIIFFGFPAWQMPFGGHQQICRSKFCSKVPFIHLLPAGVYKKYLAMCKEEQFRIDELLSIKRSKMTVEKFERLAGAAGFSIIDRTLWLISPHYKAKFNLRPARLGRFFCSIPGLRNFLSTSCFYIIG